MKHFILYILLLFISACNIPIHAQSAAPAGNSSIELRIPDKKRIEKFKKDKSFQYDTQPVRIPKWIQEKIDTIKRFLGKSASVIFSREAGLVVLILLVGIILVILVLRSQNIPLKSLFGKQKIGINDAEFITEDVNKMNFDQLIDENLKARNYRLVIRFLYLKNLKALSDRSLITWRPNKTNYSYLLEIENPSLRNRFLDTTRIFDFVWYGEFTLDNNSFQEAYAFFNEFNQLINNER